MRRNSRGTSRWLVCGLLAIETCAAQVVAPVEIKDPEMRSLQFKYLDDLKEIGAEINNLSFPYPFYLSRKLDLDEPQQKTAEQRSIRFDQYNGRTVLAITGNYYAAYSAEQVNKDQRARSTFLAVVEPILKVAVPKFQTNASVEGYAVETSHHILGKVMGVPVERPENLMVFLPQNAALKLLAAKDEAGEQAALLEGQFLINAEPVTIWLNGQGREAGRKTPVPDAPAEGEPANHAGVQLVEGTDGHGSGANAVTAFPKPVKPVNDVPHPQPPRDTSPETLAALQSANRETLATMVKEMDPQAHFVSYAAPNFVVFRQGIYLELSLNTTLNEAGAGSRYRLAAMAFDEHIAHLIRPAMGYFKPDPKQDPNFDGIGFSTTIHLTGKNQASGSEAVEFFFPLAALRSYESYDCTGQQLIDAGTVLINGERVSLDLEIAEGSAR
jgi:hypothetical protein